MLAKLFWAALAAGGVALVIASVHHPDAMAFAVHAIIGVGLTLIGGRKLGLR